jgi:hypothetical protein
MSVKVGQALARECLRHDEWYLGYECQCCGAKIAVLADGSRGETAIGGIRIGRVKLYCPYCAREGAYRDTGLVRFKHQGHAPPVRQASADTAAVSEP